MRRCRKSLLLADDLPHQPRPNATPDLFQRKQITKLQENSQKNHDEIFTRLYRYLLRPDIYFIAYQHLYSNKGAGTKGVNDDTADGFSEQYVAAIIEALRTGSYEPKPVRRTYIQKKNGKLRPLGLPVFADKLVQEAIRMILEAIYEPIFSIYSHGFRPGRSCHTALAMIKHEFTGAKWFIEGDIKGCFDNIDHSTLIGVLNRKIKDARFLNLIRMFLKSGYMEDWDFHETYSGCPQGGIISPILANIYLNEVDRYITQLKKEFDHGYNPRNFTEEYNTIRHKRDALHEKIKKAEGTMREQLIAQHKQLTKQLFRTPAKACTDKRLKYVRYADDFLIAVNGTREECEAIKAKLTDFVQDTLKMELSQEKTLITHSNTPARFLGFDVRVRRDASVKRSGKRKMRTMNNKVELNIPLKDKVETYLLSHMCNHQCGCRTDTLLECLPNYHTLYRRFTCDGRGLEMVLDRAWRLCDTLLALWYFNEPVPHICLHHFGEYSFDPCPAADESAAGDSYRRVCG